MLYLFGADGGNPEISVEHDCSKCLTSPASSAVRAAPRPAPGAFHCVTLLIWNYRFQPMYHIKLVNQGREPHGRRRGDPCPAAPTRGFPLDLVCGGRGTCGKCAVVVESG